MGFSFQKTSQILQTRNICCNCEFQGKISHFSPASEKNEKNNFNGFQSQKNDFLSGPTLNSSAENQQKTKNSLFGNLLFFSKTKNDDLFKKEQKNKNIFSKRDLNQKMKENSNFSSFEKSASQNQKKDSSSVLNPFENQKNRTNSTFFSQREKTANTQKSSPFASNWKGETQKQQVVSITYEEIGLFPRSFNRVFDRFFKQLFFDVENFVIQEYRFYRYLFLTTVKCLFILLFVPLSINFLAKNYCIRPITEYFWNTQNHEIFLNSYQQKKAFSEFKNFEEKIYFESFLFSENLIPFEFKQEKNIETKNSLFVFSKDSKRKTEMNPLFANQKVNQIPFKEEQSIQAKEENKKFNKIQIETKQLVNFDFSGNFQDSLQKRLQIKIFELANHYNEESIEAVTNFFADILSFGTLWFLLVRLEIQINITKSFLLEVFFGLDDSKKSLLILFLTDLLVGYHSPNIWELFFQTLFDHYGLPESQTTIFLLVATLPVLLDVLFKYLIFRHLNRASPATVATYHAMIE